MILVNHCCTNSLTHLHSGRPQDTLIISEKGYRSTCRHTNRVSGLQSLVIRSCSFALEGKKVLIGERNKAGDAGRSDAKVPHGCKLFSKRCSNGWNRLLEEKAALIGNATKSAD